MNRSLFVFHFGATVVNDGGSAAHAVRGLELEGERHRSPFRLGPDDDGEDTACPIFGRPTPFQRMR
jgi:hypothetical protein